VSGRETGVMSSGPVLGTSMHINLGVRFIEQNDGYLLVKLT
jgi:hypothetical protein